MTTKENNAEDWREIRARIDSIASVVFLIAGGALSLSISIILSNKNSGFVTKDVVNLATCAWYGLLGSVVLFLILKAYLILLAYWLQTRADFVNRNQKLLNQIAGSIGIVGLIIFTAGFIFMVQAAVVAVS